MMHDTGNVDGPTMNMMGAWHYHTIALFGFLLLLAVLSAVLFVFFSRRIDSAEFAFASRSKGPPAPRAGDGRNLNGAPTADTVLAIADISGYTDFMTLTRFSLSHAQYVVTELLDSVIDGMRPHLELAKVEGDAVFCIASGNGKALPGPRELGDTILAIASRFYARRDELSHSSLCKCEACTAIKSLELKIVVHRGPVLSYRLQDFWEFSGVPVIVAHRLLKNDIDQSRYIFVSSAASRAVRLPDDLDKVAHRQAYDDVGEIGGAVYAYSPDNLPPLPAQEVRSSAGGSFRDLAAKLRHSARAIRQGMRSAKGPVTPRSGGAA